MLHSIVCLIIPHYFSHPAFSNYPVLNVNLKQAIAYCKWRTDMVNIYIDLSKSKNKVQNIKKVEYFLPNINQLTKAIEVFGFSKIKKSDVTLPYYLDIPTFSKDIFKGKKLKERAIFLKDYLFEQTSDNVLFGTSYVKANENLDNFSSTGFRCMCKVENPTP